MSHNSEDDAQSLGLGVRMFSSGSLLRNLTLFSASYLESVQRQQEPLGLPHPPWEQSDQYVLEETLVTSPVEGTLQSQEPCSVTASVLELRVVVMCRYGRDGSHPCWWSLWL